MLRQWLGVERIIWLRDGIAEDAETDGHVDNVVAFAAPGARVAPRLRRSAEPEPRDRAPTTRRDCGPPGSMSIEIATLPYAVVSGATVPVPYVNFYVANEVVVVPTTGAAEDDAALATDRVRVSGTRGRRRPGCGPGVRWRWRALHHPAGPGMILRTAFDILESPARVDAPRRTPVRVGLVQHAGIPTPRRTQPRCARACCSRPAPERSWCASRS